MVLLYLDPRLISYSPDNFLIIHAENIRQRNEILNAAGDGLIAWISTEDIADGAFSALTDPVIKHTNPVMVGPELFSYDQVRTRLAKITSRLRIFFARRSLPYEQGARSKDHKQITVGGGVQGFFGPEWVAGRLLGILGLCECPNCWWS